MSAQDYDFDATPKRRTLLTWQPAVAGLLLALLVGAGVEYWILQPASAANDATEAKLVALAAENDENERLAAGYAEFLARSAEIERQALEVVEQLPADEELPPVLLSLQALATEAEVSLDKAEWRAPQPLQAGSGNYPSVVERPVMLRVRGRYFGVRKFFESFRSSPRVFKAKSLTFDGGSASILVTTYFKKAPSPAPISPGASGAAKR